MGLREVVYERREGEKWVFLVERDYENLRWCRRSRGRVVWECVLKKVGVI
jgi:hypothetical protein